MGDKLTTKRERTGREKYYRSSHEDGIPCGMLHIRPQNISAVKHCVHMQSRALLYIKMEPLMLL